MEGVDLIIEFLLMEYERMEKGTDNLLNGGYQSQLSGVVAKAVMEYVKLEMPGIEVVSGKEPSFDGEVEHIPGRGYTPSIGSEIPYFEIATNISESIFTKKTFKFSNYLQDKEGYHKQIASKIVKGIGDEVMRNVQNLISHSNAEEKDVVVDIGEGCVMSELETLKLRFQIVSFLNVRIYENAPSKVEVGAYI